MALFKAAFGKLKSALSKSNEGSGAGAVVRNLLIGKPPKPGKPEKYIAQWNGTKIGLIDEIPYSARPWEIEAHEWQHKLVSEFVDRYAKDEGV